MPDNRHKFALSDGQAYMVKRLHLIFPGIVDLANIPDLHQCPHDTAFFLSVILFLYIYNETGGHLDSPDSSFIILAYIIITGLS